MEFHETLPDPAEESLDIEGRKFLRRHVTKERSAKLIEAFKAQLTDFTCLACGFSFETAYGALGMGFIEAHHTIPIATLAAETVMSISDLVPLCSNCHRMLQTITVDFDGTPGMGLHQIGKILLPLFQAQLIRATIKTFTDPAHSTRIGINGFFAFALQLEQTQVTLIKFFKSIRFSLVHGISPFVLMVPGIGQSRERYTLF
ncbi:MAG: HNH endonuclease [Desulforhabdus sp.]|nr:HNH endonuclease [Desulforhabdus sp.]